MRDEGAHLSIGWRDYASFAVETSSRGGGVSATLMVEPSDAATAFVFSVLPLLLPLWGLEPFHGSAVKTTKGALVVLGPSGAGKSSVAAALERRGFPLLSDDTSAIDGDLQLWPGPPAVNPRWADALQLPVGEYNEKKIRTPALYSNDPGPVVALIVLAPAPVKRIEATAPPTTARMKAILANARHGVFLQARRRELQFLVATGLGRLPLALATLDPSRHGPEDVIVALTAWFDEVGILAPAREPGTSLESA
jgi:hypothetical protein